MPIETSVTLIADLNASYPENADVASKGSDHIRNVKTAMKSLNTSSATAGAAQVGFLQSGTGALTTRKVQDKLRERITVTDFDVDTTGVADCSTGFTNAATAASGKTLRIPAGTYKISTNTTLNCDLVFDRGAKLVATNATVTIGGYIQAPIRQQVFDWSGTGAYSISSDRMVHARWFGANPTGGNDNQAAVQKAVDSIGLGIVHFTAGTYEFNSAVSVAKSRVGFTGEGLESTILTKKSLTGNVFTFQPADITTTTIADLTIRDLTFQTAAGDVHTNGAFVMFFGCQRVRMLNCLMTDPCYGVIVRSSANVELFNVQGVDTGAASFTGQAHFLFDEDSTAVKREPSNAFVTNCMGRGVAGSYVTLYGALIQASDGIWFDGCYFGSKATADIGFSPKNADSQITGVKIDNCWCDPVGASGHGIRFGGATSDYYGLTTITNCHIAGGLSGASGIHIVPTAGTTIVGLKIDNNLFFQWNSSGINVTGNGTTSVRGLTVNGNTFIDCGATSGSNIVLDDVTHFSINGNVGGYKLNGAASGADYGAVIAAGCTEFTLNGNAFTGNAVGGVSDGSGGVTKSVANNVP